MTSQTGQQMITIHILPDISRRKDNQRIKFVQLIEYNIRGICLKKSYTKHGGGASPRPFKIKIKIENISGSTVWNVIKFVFIVCPSRGLLKYIKTKALSTCFYFIKSFFKK